MTSSPVSPVTTRPPTGIRIASTICWVVGVMTLGVAVAVYVPPVNHTPEGLSAFLIMMATGTAVCAAAYLVRKRKKLGAYLVVAAWAFPLVWALGVGAPVRGNLLLLIAMLALLANWRYLE
jgi:hypothetical protein